MALPARVSELIEAFTRNRDSYKHSNYNETELRREYIDPLFAQLGWDVDNSAGYADAYKDVIHEESLRVADAVNAPDYSFRVGGTRKFFLEAKRPAVAVSGSASSAHQIRSYGWSAKLPLCILTNFDETAIYDCRIEPLKGDSPGLHRIKLIKYSELEAEWEFLQHTFSKDAVLKGSFDKYAIENKLKRGTLEVDESFLERIRGWRKDIAASFVRLNKGITESDLDYAVQQTIDRIVFLRICEDRGIEEYGALRAIRTGAGVYDRLKARFHAADDKFDSGLFHFRKEKSRLAEPDTLTLGLKLEDGVLRDMLRDLYYPDSPYQFSVISADVLGQVYEQFLGEQIRLTPLRSVKLDVKPDVRKAGGVFYTPTYVVDEIVSEVLSPLVEGKAPNGISDVTVVDPACGSGSFLIKAYQFLLEWYLAAYVSIGAQRLSAGQSPRLRQVGSGGFRLTIAERKRILLAHIFGVDLDPQAVEVTKLNLLLKVLEGESQETIANELKLLQARALPDLDENILCGNSLIDVDIFAQPGAARLKPASRDRVNPFSWKRRFQNQMAHGGFAAIIGNPPYIQLSMAAYFNATVNDYLAAHYSSSMGRLNTFGFFIERSLGLLRKNGLLGFIVPNTILTQGYYKELRSELLERSLKTIINYREPVFSAAVVDTCSIIVMNSKAGKADTVHIRWYDKKNAFLETHDVAQSVFEAEPKRAFLVNADIAALTLREKLDARGKPLGKFANLNQAIALRQDRAASLFTASKGKDYKPLLDGRNIGRYSLEWTGTYLKYDVDAIHSCKRTDIFEADEKLLLRRVGARLTLALDASQFYALNTLVVITVKATQKVSLRYLLAVLNSRLLNYYYFVFLKSTKKTFSEVQARQLAEVPIVINAKSATIARLEELADRMTGLVVERNSAKNPQRKDALNHELQAVDRAIDRIVYDLYGLTTEEVDLVEKLPVTSA